MNKYTSLILSKFLAENDCKLKSEMWWWDWEVNHQRYWLYNHPPHSEIDYYPAYDILNDICVKYATKFFGDKEGTHGKTTYILYLLQQNETQEAEDYIWEHCKYNKKNR